MDDMPHWNTFVKRMLSEKQDKGDKMAFANNLTSRKRIRKGEKNE